MDKRREAFCREYLVDLNGTQAVIRAGYSHRGASVQATRLLANASVQARIAELVQERAERVELTADWVLKSAAEAFKVNATLVPNVNQAVYSAFIEGLPEDMDPDERRQRIDEFLESHPKVMVNAAAAAKFLEQVGKHVNIQAFRENVNVNHTVDYETILNEARQRVERAAPVH